MTELRAERRVERGVSNGVELQVLEDRLETSNERVEQLKVCVCTYTAFSVSLYSTVALSTCIERVSNEALP